MLYELAAGRLPFAGDDPLTVIAQHLHAPAVPPSTYNPDIPAPLESLIMRLMSKQPEDRPATAAEVEHTLERIARKSTDLILAAAERRQSCRHSNASCAAGWLDATANWPKRALAWQNATGENAADFPHVLLISGESGVGKTPFVRACVRLPRCRAGAGCTASATRRAARRTAAFDQAFGARGRVCRSRALATALPPWIACDLVRLAPSLRAVFPDAPRSRRATASGCSRASSTTCEMLIATPRGRAPAPAPLMFVIEDVQWADAATLGAAAPSCSAGARAGAQNADRADVSRVGVDRGARAARSAARLHPRAPGDADPARTVRPRADGRELLGCHVPAGHSSRPSSTRSTARPTATSFISRRSARR